MPAQFGCKAAFSFAHADLARDDRGKLSKRCLSSRLLARTTAAKGAPRTADARRCGRSLSVGKLFAVDGLLGGDGHQHGDGQQGGSHGADRHFQKDHSKASPAEALIASRIGA
jgi:hypothetical protein